jgi:hypothetical protein
MDKGGNGSPSKPECSAARTRTNPTCSRVQATSIRLPNGLQGNVSSDRNAWAVDGQGIDVIVQVQSFTGA